MSSAQAPSFFDLFGRTPTVGAAAHGRVNLIGEHTDYNGGFVMPIAIPQQTTVELAGRLDDRVRAYSADMSNGQPILEYVIGREAPRRSWIDYVQGLTQALQEQGHTLGGFDLRITSTVPVGSGLSSSAALEIAVLRGVDALLGLRLEPIAMARLGQHAENAFVGAPVGIMDQMAAAIADEHAALFLDTRNLHYERTPWPDTCELAVIDSGLSHAHASGEYRVRRAECERAAALLGVVELRELSDTGAPWAALPGPLDRRVQHVVTENQRVHLARAAMLSGDAVALGRVLTASHVSMRDDYEVSLPAIDRLIELALKHDSVLGARLTGGGFGGCILVLTRRHVAAQVADRIVEEARASGRGEPSVVVSQLPSA